MASEPRMASANAHEEEFYIEGKPEKRIHRLPGIYILAYYSSFSLRFSSKFSLYSMLT